MRFIKSLGDGVIGNTTGFGPVVQGSSPCPRTMSKIRMHELFPTLVTEHQYNKNNDVVSAIYKSWESHYTNGYSDELTGNLDIHIDPVFYDLYKFLTQCVVEYLEASGIDSTNFQINFVKSWFNSLEFRPTPSHSHKDAHISITYYAQIPPFAEQSLCFKYVGYDREPFAGITDFNSNNTTRFNSRVFTIKPEEGVAIVFPASLIHYTQGAHSDPNAIEPPVHDQYDLKRKRICIASDVILTYKDKSKKSTGLQPISQWRTFD